MTESINRLLGVSDRETLDLVSCDRLENALLKAVRVLVFVNDDFVKSVLQFRNGRAVFFFQKFQGFFGQVGIFKNVLLLFDLFVTIDKVTIEIQKLGSEPDLLFKNFLDVGWHSCRQIFQDVQVIGKKGIFCV